MMNWEKIDECTERARVHKGWLVRHWSDDGGTRMAICFVPDPMHGWKL